jgi:ATP-dependent Clp protease adaptor protein ClpS
LAQAPLQQIFQPAASYVIFPLMNWRLGPGVMIAPEQITTPRAAVKAPELIEETGTKQAIDLPWQVVVHNDPVNLMTYVTMVFQKVFGYPREKAERHMLEVHHKGRSILWSGMRERAELYVQQLHGYLLLATIERVN